MPDRAAKVVVAYCCFHCNLLNRLPSQSIFSISLTIRKDTHSKGVYLFTFFNILIFLRQLAEASLIFPIRQAFPVWSTVKQSKKKKKKNKKEKEEEEGRERWKPTVRRNKLFQESLVSLLHLTVHVCRHASTFSHLQMGLQLTEQMFPHMPACKHSCMLTYCVYRHT